MGWIVFLVLGLSRLLAAQPPQLENTGKPMMVTCPCTEEDIQSLGMSCSPERPCPIYLEITAVEPVGTRVFLTGNLHTDTVTLYSVLLASEDSGKTWREAYERIRQAGLDQIQFVDFEAGWISGQVLQTVPRDPFFLITGDGGRTWRRRPVYGESRAGTVENFSFESRTAGAMILDRVQTGEGGGRYARYETLTGGDTWMIREVSAKPMALKRTHLPNTDWRVEPHAATKSFRVERRQGEAWQLVASFLVQAGECKPEERPLEPPPEPPKPPEPVPAQTKQPPTLKKKKQ